MGGLKKDWIDKYIEKRREEERLRCPNCNYVENDDEVLNSFITYWGEDDPIDFECSNCEAKLLVEERVRRTYKVTIAEIEGS